jgi:hypothetical protein
MCVIGFGMIMPMRSLNYFVRLTSSSDVRDVQTTPGIYL